MTDNPTALSAEELVVWAMPDAWPSNCPPDFHHVQRLLTTITAKDAEIAAQAEAIRMQGVEAEALTEEITALRSDLDGSQAEVATLKAEVARVTSERDTLLHNIEFLRTATERALTAEAEVAALRRENEQLRVDLRLADAAQHLPAALSPKEAPKP